MAKQNPAETLPEKIITHGEAQQKTYKTWILALLAILGAGTGIWGYYKHQDTEKILRYQNHKINRAHRIALHTKFEHNARNHDLKAFATFSGMMICTSALIGEYFGKVTMTAMQSTVVGGVSSLLAFVTLYQIYKAGQNSKKAKKYRT